MILSPLHLIESGQVIRATLGPSHEEKEWTVHESRESDRRGFWFLKVGRSKDVAEMDLKSGYLFEIVI